MSTTARGRRGALVPRAVRMRNACVRHAADRLGLELPADEDLRALGDDVSLREAVDWWQSQAGSTAVEPGARSAGVPFVTRAAVATAVTLIGLALSFGRAQ